MEKRTLLEYKEHLSELTKDECYEFMYDMSRQLCNINEYVDSQIERMKKHPYSVGINMLKKIKKLLGEYE